MCCVSQGPRGSRSGAEVLPIRQDFIENMCGMLEVVGPLDEWRLQLVRMMCCAGLRATAQQALQLTMSFGESMGRERGQVSGCIPSSDDIRVAIKMLTSEFEGWRPSRHRRRSLSLIASLEKSTNMLHNVA